MSYHFTLIFDTGSKKNMHSGTVIIQFHLKVLKSIFGFYSYYLNEIDHVTNLAKFVFKSRDTISTILTAVKIP